MIMRDIKFRAWDKWDNEYFKEIETVVVAGDGEIGIYDGSEWMGFGDYQDRFILEQYTGLKGKNGVEIYENDIIKTVKEDVDFENEVYQIVYNETGDYPAFDLKGWRGEVNGISELITSYGIKVIGNIHEQPELLEDM